MKKEYKPRIADKILREHLEYSNAVLIEGAKWCGKTSTAIENSNSQLFMQNPDNRNEYLLVADTKPSLLLQGETPRLLDEWQTAPVLWDSVRFESDQRGIPGQFILTGSAMPLDNVVEHTGTGRFSRMIMRPMSLFESNESNGTVSILDLFNGKTDIDSMSDLSLEQIAVAIVRGGWPASIDQREDIAIKHSINYVESIINQDVSQFDNIQKNPARVRALMKSLARNVSTLATIKTLHDDIAQGDTGDSLSEKSISQYLSVLERIFVIDNIPAWCPSIRSKTAIRTSSKRQFVDPSIATAVMRLTPSRLFEDFNYFGFLFESLCSRDLKIYSEAIDGELFHYRDSSGLECDAIIALNDGRWAAIEVKLGSNHINDAAKNLISIKRKINTDKMKEPSFMMILTTGNLAYRRSDGIFVVPIGCLKD